MLEDLFSIGGRPLFFHSELVARICTERAGHPSFYGLPFRCPASGMVSEGLLRQLEEPRPDIGLRQIVRRGRAEQFHKRVLDAIRGLELGQALLLQPSDENRPVDSVDLAPRRGVFRLEPEQ